MLYLGYMIHLINFVIFVFISMVYWKTAVSPPLAHWRYYCLALNHRFIPQRCNIYDLPSAGELTVKHNEAPAVCNIFLYKVSPDYKMGHHLWSHLSYETWLYVFTNVISDFHLQYQYIDWIWCFINRFPWIFPKHRIVYCKQVWNIAK